MNELLGHAALLAGVDLQRSPWMEFALWKLRTQQPASPAAESDVFRFLDTVKDSSNPKLPHVQHWDHKCTPWCSAFVNWCLKNANYPGTNDALAIRWLDWGKASHPYWGAVAVITSPVQHVGFYILEKNGHRYILGGNQGGRTGHLSSVTIAAFGHHCHISYRAPVV